MSTTSDVPPRLLRLSDVYAEAAERNAQPVGCLSQDVFSAAHPRVATPVSLLAVKP